MDIRYGLDYIVENKEHVQKLGTALDTTNVTVKKQIFELLSALCAYNAEGYARAIETLEYYKVCVFDISFLFNHFILSYACDCMRTREGETYHFNIISKLSFSFAVGNQFTKFKILFHAPSRQYMNFSINQ